MPDQILAETFRSTREDRFFAEIVRRHQGPIQAACGRVLRNRSEAEDIAQDTFVAAFTKIDTYRGGNLGAWLSVIARHLCLNRLEARLTKPAEASTDMGDLAAPESFEAASHWADECRVMLSQLSPPQQLSIKLFFIEGYSYKEVAGLTGFSEEQVKTHIQNGKRRLRTVWEQMGQVKES